MQDFSHHSIPQDPPSVSPSSEDFKTIAEVLTSDKGEQPGKLLGHDLYLNGNKKWIKQDQILTQLMHSFKNMSVQEKRENLGLLKRCLLQVKNSHTFSKYDKLSARISLKTTVFFIEKSLTRGNVATFETRGFNAGPINNIINAVRGMFRKDETPIVDPLSDPIATLNENAKKHENRPRFQDAGKTIVQEWDDRHGHKATETIERRDVVDSFKKNAVCQLNYIQQRIDTEDLKPDVREKLQSLAERLNETIVKCENSDITWADSDYFRDMLRGDYKIASSKNPDELAGAIMAWEATMESQYLPLAPAVNMRFQTCETIKHVDSWLRVGVISDMSNGYVNLTSMETLNNALQNNDLDTASHTRSIMAREIITAWKSALSNNNINVDASAGYALKQLGYTMNEIHSIKNSIDRKRPIDDKLLSIIKGNAQFVKMAVAKSVMQRCEVMEKQFLQVIADHALRIDHKDVQSGTMKLLHVCLLNQASNVVDGSGWYHSEENEMLDMAAIFDRFNGKKLIADSNGPFIDKNGNIHVPPSSDFPEKKEITLCSSVINQCVAGHQKNSGAQREINERAAANLSRFQLDPNGDLERILKGKKTSFSSAADAVDFGMKLGFKLSTGCLSAKDRTGFVCALKTDRTLRDKGFFPRSSRRRILVKQLSENSPEVAVIKDNTGTAIIKIKPFMIEGVTKGTFHIPSIAARTIIYIRQGIEIIKERERVRKWEKTGKPKT